MEWTVQQSARTHVRAAYRLHLDTMLRIRIRVQVFLISTLVER